MGVKVGVSRRDFLRSAGLVAGGVALGGLTGCGTAGDSEVAGATPVVPAAFEVYDTDVLIVGGGFAGQSAALEAFAAGANVIVIDKGPFQFSGGCGMNWDQYLYSVTDSDMAGKFYYWLSGGTANQVLDQKLMDAIGNDKMLKEYANRGTTTFLRDEKGDIVQRTTLLPGSSINEHLWARHGTDLIKSNGIKIVERTMITNLYIQDGVCVGALGIHLPSGGFRVFRAKATVAAAGPTTWFYNWISVAPITLGSPDNTGDMDAIALRNGCAVQDCEFFAGDLISIYPEGLAASYNGGIGADDLNYTYVCDKDGVYWMKDIPESEMNRGRFARECAQRVLDGKGSPNGGVYIDCRSDVFYNGLRDTYRRNVIPYKEKFGIDVRAGLLEVAYELYEHATTVVTDENFMSAVPALFMSRGGGTGAARGGFGIPQVTAGGMLTGQLAAAYAATAPALDTIDWEPVHVEYERVQEMRTRTVDGGLRASAVRHMIQKACAPAFGAIKEAASLQACIDELARIRTEELPKTTCASTTLVYNTEWKEAIENQNLLDMAEASARSALAREETRGEFYRSDFQERDNDNFLCNMVIAWGDDGMVLEKRPIISVWSEDEVKAFIDAPFAP